MITIEVNHRGVPANDGERLLDVLRREGIKVPTLCHIPGLPPSGACRLCVVEIEGRDDLVPSCSFPVQPDLKVLTHSARAVEARRMIVELLLSDHPDDCLHCAANDSCQLLAISKEFAIHGRRFPHHQNPIPRDVSSPAIVRDPAKCILCGRCVRVCEEIQGVAAIDFIGRGSRARVGTAFEEGLNVSSCVSCGQCILVCPTGALTEHADIEYVQAALRDPEKIVVIQHAPSVSVTLAEFFGHDPGEDAQGALTAVLRRFGFDRVFDTAFSADLTIMEEASELVARIQKGGPLPLLTSCSPGWVTFLEQCYPHMLENVPSCKSPQQMLGAIVKSYYAQCEGIDSERIVSVAIMPCTAKKLEARRPHMASGGLADVDAVLTTRELAQMIRLRGLTLDGVGTAEPDLPFGTRSSAGKLFGATGGVTEAALRTAHHLITGEQMPERQVPALRGLDGRKEAHVQIGDVTVGVAVCSDLSAAGALMEEVRDGRDDLHFIEVMTCPGGCIAGGGQPVHGDREAIAARMRRLYQIDDEEVLRTSHENPAIQELYQRFLGQPLSERSHALLHTRYSPRKVLV